MKNLQNSAVLNQSIVFNLKNKIFQKSKNLMVLFVFLTSFLSFAQVNSNYHYVDGYYKSNGTYVNGYYRTNPNNTNKDNYSTYPNINPWTGNQGTVKPDNNYTMPDFEFEDTSYSTSNIEYLEIYNSPTYSLPIVNYENNYNSSYYTIPSTEFDNVYDSSTYYTPSVNYDYINY